MSRIGVANPGDDCPYAKSNANTFVRARAYRVFLTSCVGINLGDIPRGLRHPQDVPSVDPSTLGPKTLYELASLKYCYNAVNQQVHTKEGGGCMKLRRFSCLQARLKDAKILFRYTLSHLG